ncbi:ribonuclease H-like domain-containing protein [Rhizophagus irregularis DAOM 181602=DAOM 197198]|nr:ribonuclease H-like domain-containing protein [Rhizophagus irregularis DAOM 181602=DAOM 197198]
MNSQQKEKKPSDRSQSEVWKHFEKKPLKSAGHFSAKCNYCKTFWACGHPQQLEEHLANNCKECPELVYAFYLGVVSSRDFGSEDASIPSPENNKKRKIQVEQRELTDWFESAKITPQKEASITRALVCAFTCCGISFSIIENPFFIEFLHEMRPGYVPPSCELLSGRFLNQETARINKKVKKIIEDSENLTLAIDGWTSLSGASIYNYIILTPDREQYLYSLNDYSSDYHTGEFLASEITNIIGKIGSEKITALVTDNAANCIKAREIVISQFSNIIDLRCIAHFINLITKQIMGHDMAKQTIKSCNRIISFFKQSHIVGKLLADAATTLQIEGGGLKTYSETRWTSMYEAANSVSRLQIALEHVLMNNPDEITNKSVKRSIKGSEFFVNVNKLTKVLKPIKTAITLLEGASTNLADYFIQLILLANAIKKLPSQEMVGFHQHCIESFNKYWDKTRIKNRILENYNHYCSAGQIWRNNGGDKKLCNRLLAQIRNYELRRSPYNQDFDNSLETPMSWWYSIKDKYDYLKDLAIMIFSITPHSAGCERIFSTLSWLYGKRRQRLDLSTIESMAKIRSYYLSNMKNELTYTSQQYTNEELYEMINNSTFLQFEEEDDKVDNRIRSPTLEIPNYEVRVLIIENYFDLKDTVKGLNNNDKNSDDSDVESDSDSDVGSDIDSENLNDSANNNSENETESDYDVEELVQQHLLDDDLIGNTTFKLCILIK